MEHRLPKVEEEETVPGPSLAEILIERLQLMEPGEGTDSRANV
jgi:hypothetical protein